MSYLVSVDVLPDRREETQRDYENNLIEMGEAARCEECGQVFDDVVNYGSDSDGVNAICAECAEYEANAITSTIRRLTLETANREEKIRVATALSFLSDYSEEFQQYLREGH